MKILLSAMILSAASVVSARPAATQAQNGTEAGIRFSGIVTELGTEAAVAGAHVALSLARGPGGVALTTDEGGHFSYAPVEGGTYAYEIRRPGYRPFRDSIALEAHHEYRLRIELVPDSVERDPVVEVEPWRISSRIGDFRRRSQAGWGTYFTREDIERIQPTLVTDLLRRVPGVRIAPILAGVANDFTMRGGCRPALFVDDLLMTGMLASDLDRQFSPVEVEGIEVYVGNQAPGKLNRSPCGAVAVWSRTFDPGGAGGQVPRRLLLTGVVVVAGLLLGSLFF